MPDHPTDPNCIFCKIAHGQVPCHKLYENDQVLAFLDLGPLSDGHTLIIPKGHYETLDQMPDDVAGVCMAIAPRLSRAIQQSTGVREFNILQNNGKLAHQAVGHVHFHIIPKTPEAGLEIGWPAQQLDDDEAGQLRNNITAALESDHT